MISAHQLPDVDANVLDTLQFEYGYAVVSSADNTYGLVDRDGRWVVAPDWLYLTCVSENFFIAENMQHRWGAINIEGSTLVEFLSVAEWNQSALFKHADPYEIIEPEEAESARMNMVETIKNVRNVRYRERIKKALGACKDSLAAMEGILEPHTSEFDLRQSGVWGRRVRLLRGKTTGFHRPSEGEVGYIGCCYPVSLDIFELSTEAPVNSLESCSQAAVGIPWCDLELLEDNANVSEARETVAGFKLKDATSLVSGSLRVIRDLLACVLGFLFVWLCVGLPGIGLNIIVNAIHKHDTIGPIIGVLCGVYIVVLLIKIVTNIIRNKSEYAVYALAQAYHDGVSFFVWNLGGFLIWLGIVLTYKGVANDWFALVWEVIAIGGILFMFKRLYSTNSSLV